MKPFSVYFSDEWVQLEYRNGTPYTHKCSHQNRRAHIMIVCDAQVPQVYLAMFQLYRNSFEKQDCIPVGCTLTVVPVRGGGSAVRRGGGGGVGAVQRVISPPPGQKTRPHPLGPDHILPM